MNDFLTCVIFCCYYWHYACFVIWLILRHYGTQVFESSLNNLKLFFSMSANSNKIIQFFFFEGKTSFGTIRLFSGCVRPVEKVG